jgi:cell division protein FtsB
MLEDSVRKYGLYIVLAALFIQLVFLEGGIYGNIKMWREIRSADASIASVEKENLRLRKEIERLKTDDRYLEEVARTRYGFLKEGEKLYRTEK